MYSVAEESPYLHLTRHIVVCARCVHHATINCDAYEPTWWIMWKFSNFWATLFKLQSLTFWHKVTHKTEKDRQTDRSRNCWLGERLLWSRRTVTSHTSSGLRHRRFGVPCVKGLRFGRLWSNYREHLEWINRGDMRNVMIISRSAVRMLYLCVTSAHRHPLHVRPTNEPLITTLVIQRAI